MSADDTAADDQHAPRQHARHPTEQHTAPAIGLLQRPGPDLRGQPARHLGHRGQQRQPAPVIGDGLVSNGGDARGQQIGGLRRIGGEMQVGEQHLAFAQAGALGGLRFLDLDDHRGLRKDLLCGGQDLRPRREIIGIGEARSDARAGFDQHLMAMRDSLTRRIGGHADAVFLRLDLFRASDFHGHSSWAQPPRSHQPRADALVKL